jgi:hypothetical protein
MNIQKMIEKKEIQSVLELQEGKFYLFLIDESSVHSEVESVESLLKELDAEGLRAMVLMTDGEHVFQVFELEKGGEQ